MTGQRLSDVPGQYLAEGLPPGGARQDGLDLPFWNGLAQERLLIQRCGRCGSWQWGPEWICHNCLSFDLGWDEVAPRGQIYSWERNWHPSHDALRDQGPYLVVLVELPEAAGIRLIGNLLGDPLQTVAIGSPVVGLFEHHREASPNYSLLQWRIAR